MSNQVNRQQKKQNEQQMPLVKNRSDEQFKAETAKLNLQEDTDLENWLEKTEQVI